MTTRRFYALTAMWLGWFVLSLVIYVFPRQAQGLPPLSQGIGTVARGFNTPTNVVAGLDGPMPLCDATVNGASSLAIVVSGSVATTTPAAGTDVNLASVGGAAVKTGNGTASGAQRVTLASDSTGQLTLAAGTAAVGTVSLNIALVGSFVNTGKLASTGTTQVVLATAVAGKAAYVFGTFSTTSTVTESVTVYSMPSGQVVDFLVIPPGPGDVFIDPLHPEQSVQGESLAFALASGNTTVVFAGKKANQ